jgi:hypothetical protein
VQAVIWRFVEIELNGTASEHPGAGQARLFVKARGARVQGDGDPVKSRFDPDALAIGVAAVQNLAIVGVPKRLGDLADWKIKFERSAQKQRYPWTSCACAFRLTTPWHQWP